MNADVAVAIDTLELGGKGVAPMRQLRTQLKLQDGAAVAVMVEKPSAAKP